MKNTKVTALVNAYFSEKYIGKRIENLMEQKPAPGIVVVCQNASVEAQTAFNAGAVTVLTPDIPSISAALNLGLATAKGDYIVFANTDDTFYPGALKKMAHVLDKHPEIDVVFGDCDKMNPGRLPREWKRCNQPPGEYDTSEMKNGRYILGAMPMWRKSLGFFDEKFKVALDFEFFMRALSNGSRFWYLGEPVGVYLQNPDGYEWKHRELCLREHGLVMEKYAHLHESNS